MSSKKTPKGLLDDIQKVLSDPNKKVEFFKLLQKVQESSSAGASSSSSSSISQGSLKKIKRAHAESPTALFRKRFVAKGTDSSETSSSEQNDASDYDVPKVPHNKLLEGVIGYVEVKKNDEDRSASFKKLMTLMGADVRDKFTSDVTHVVFKDGSFTTYEKAKLLRKHLVSISWLLKIKECGRRVPEKHFRAFGINVDNEEISTLCSQIQREFGDVIKEERRQSLLLNSQRSQSQMRNKRKTLAHSSLFEKINGNVNVNPDQEVATITSTALNMMSPEVTSDDSESAMIDGEIAGKSKYLSLLRDDSLFNQESVSNKAFPLKNIVSENPQKTDESQSLITKRKSDKKSNQTSIARNLFHAHNDTTKSDEMRLLQGSSTMSSLRLSLDTDKTKSGLDLSIKNTEKSLRISSTTSQNEEHEKENHKSNFVKANLSKSPADEDKLDKADNNFAVPPIPKSRSCSVSRERKTSSDREDKKKHKTCDSSESDGSTSKTSNVNNSKLSKKKTRKLYTPDEDNNIADLKSDDEKERRERALQVASQTSPNRFFINSCGVLTPCENKAFDSSATSDESTSGNYSSFKPTDAVKKNSTKLKQRSCADEKLDDRDEQTELLRLLDEKNHAVVTPPKQKRKSMRIASLKKKYCSEKPEEELPITPLKRRSTMDFQNFSQRTKMSASKKKLTSIVCTKMSRHDVARVQKIVKNMGGFVEESTVSDRTTHLVMGNVKRTVNFLRALARGCWILKYDWVLKSYEKGKWLPEADFEITDFVPTVQKCRIEREAFGPTYRIDIFKNCGKIFVGQSTSPPREELAELITLCQGTITTTLRSAKIVVGAHVATNGVSCVTESWILDSITHNKLAPIKKYLIAVPKSPSF